MIETMLRGLFNEHTRLRKKEKPLARVIACFFERFFRVHPFRDGNGRVARLYADRVALEHGFTFRIQYTRKQRRRYISALEIAHRKATAADGSYDDPTSSSPGVFRQPLYRLEKWVESVLEEIEYVDVEPPGFG